MEIVLPNYITEVDPFLMMKTPALNSCGFAGCTDNVCPKSLTGLTHRWWGVKQGRKKNGTEKITFSEASNTYFLI